MRVFEVAKELGVDHRALLNTCDKLRIRVKNYMSEVKPADFDRLREALRPGRPAHETLLLRVPPDQAPAVLEPRPHHDRVQGPSDRGPSDREGVLEVKEEDLLAGPTPFVPAKVLEDAPSRSQPNLELTPSDPSDARTGGSAETPPFVSAKTVEDSLTRWLHDRGLNFQDTNRMERWTLARRFLGAVRAAQHVGALVLLSGTTGTGKSALVRHVGDILQGGGVAELAVRPEWLQAADLVGYVDPIERIFVPTEFIAAVRAASASELQGDKAPFLVLLDEMNLARIESYGADLLSRLELPAGDHRRSLDLYPDVLNRRWAQELAQLHSTEDREGQARRATLESWLLTLGDPTKAHRLALPGNLCIVGTLNTDQHTHQLSPKVLDRAFVLQRADPSVEEIFAIPTGQDASAGRDQLVLPPVPSPFPGLHDWAGLEEVRARLKQLMAHWASFGFAPSRRLVRNARTYLAYAELDDAQLDDAVGDLLHLLLIPRLVLAADEAVRFCDGLSELTEKWFANRHPARLEVQALRERAECSRYGDVRGLR